MLKLTLGKLAVIFVFLFCGAFFVKYVFAETPVQISFGESTLGGNDLHSTSMTFGDTWHFTVTVPSNYSGSSIKLGVSGSSCLSMYVNTPCSSTKGSSSSCITSASAGQQVNFDVEVWYGYCKEYDPGSFYVKASEVVLKNDGESCTSLYECKSYHCAAGKCYTPKYSDGSYCYNASQCKGGFCNNNECASSPLTCGNGTCDSEETSYNCASDCPLQYDNGYACESASQCKNGYCVHDKCRSSATFCGDYYCEGTETCDNCYSDCMSSCKYDDGTGCSTADKCKGGYCVHGVCRSSSSYCGDKYCDTDLESCYYCSADCGACPVVKKENGQSCKEHSECKNGYCVHGYCRSDYVYCGDTFCDSEESCSNCYTDCGYCENPKKSIGSTCSSYEECETGYCSYGYCEKKRKANGESCSTGSECEGWYCVHGACRSSATHCGDYYCDNGELCSDCSTDCGSCVAAPATQKMAGTIQIISVTSVAANGSARQKVEQIYSANLWKDVLGTQKITTKLLKDAEKSYTDLLKKTGFAPQKVSLKIDKNRRALVLDISFGKYALFGSKNKREGYENKWVAGAPAEIAGEGAVTICSVSGRDIQIKDKKVIFGLTQKSSSSIYEMEYQIKQTLNLPDKATDIAVDEEKCFVSYKLMACNPNVSTSCKAGQYCSKETFQCLPRLANSGSCSYGSQCLSNKCSFLGESSDYENKICCAKGGLCCKSDSDCGSDKYCEAKKLFSCVAKKANGQKCDSKLATECASGYCKNGKCAIPNILDVLVPKSITLKKGEQYKLPISIKNVSPIAVTVGEYIVLGDLPKFISSIYSNTLRIYKQNLQPGEEVSTKSEQQEDLIETFEFEGKTAGSGKLTFGFDYVTDKGAQKFSAIVPIEVKNIHVARDATATALFKQNMILVQEKDKYIFVAPEDNEKIIASIDRWRTARAAFNQGVDTLIGQAEDAFKPDLLSFAETIQDMTKQETPKKITEALIKSLIPAQVQAGANFLSMMTPFKQQQAEETFLLKTFGAKNLTNISNYDEFGQFTGYTVAITKEKGGTVYALVLGDF